MRYLHTGDWHLGRIFHGLHRTAEQAEVLDALIDIARRCEVELVVIAGDLFDRAVPPPEAVALLDDTLNRLVLDLGLAVVLIAGNHDSPRRLGYGARLLESQRLFIVGQVPETPRPIILEDRHGPVAIHAFPYAEPGFITQALGSAPAPDPSAAMRAWVEASRARQGAIPRSIAVAHAHVEGGLGSESERPLAFWDRDRLDRGVFAAFDDVALGHLHRPQTLACGRQHYSGSLLKYSFGEANDEKSVRIVDMDARGRCHSERIPLPVGRDVRCLVGSFAELLAAEDHPHARAYLRITLLDPGPILDPMSRLRERYPNLLHIDRAATEERAKIDPGERVRALQRRGEAEVFEDFFTEVTGAAPDGDERAALRSVLDQLGRRRREEREP